MIFTKPDCFYKYHATVNQKEKKKGERRRKFWGKTKENDPNLNYPAPTLLIDLPPLPYRQLPPKPAPFFPLCLAKDKPETSPSQQKLAGDPQAFTKKEKRKATADPPSPLSSPKAPQTNLSCTPASTGSLSRRSQNQRPAVAPLPSAQDSSKTHEQQQRGQPPLPPTGRKTTNAVASTKTTQQRHPPLVRHTFLPPDMPPEGREKTEKSNREEE